MRLIVARRWLAVYFLLITTLSGGYLLLFGETALLPISQSDATAAFQIIIPVLIGQITIIFQWIAQLNAPENPDAISPIPVWAIKLPPLLVALLIIVSVVLLAAGNLGGGHRWGLSPQGFKGVLTFAVSLLNATTVFLVGKLFAKAKSDS
jgi:hypothetical protein